MRLTCFLFLLSLHINGLAQSEWINYSAIDDISEIEVFADQAFVANEGGLLIIDLITKEEKLLVPSNSDFVGHSDEIEFLSNGHAWISGSHGLWYYDGFSFEIFETIEEIARPSNLRIYNDELWFKDYYGNLFSIKDKVLTEHTDKFDEPILFIEFDLNGKLWVVHGSDVSYFNGNEIVSTRGIVPNADIWDIYSFFIDDKDILWFSLRINGLGFEVVSLDSEKRSRIETTYLADKLFSHDSLDICFWSSYELVGFVKDGEVELDSIVNILPEVPQNFGRLKLMKWDEDNIWISSTDRDDFMIHRFTDSGLIQYGLNQDFLGATSDLATDCDGNLYKAGWYNLEKFVDDKWEPIYPDYHQDECRITHFKINPFTCELWADGISGSLGCNSLWKISEDEIVEFEILNESSTGFAFSEDGKVYITQGTSGALHYIDSLGLIKPIEIEDAFAFTILHVTADNAFWSRGVDISDSLYNAYFVIKDEELTQYSYKNTPLSRDLSRWMYEDNNGDLWFSNEEGLVNFDGEEWTTYALDMEIIVRDMFQDDIGNYWLATIGAGLLYWDKQNLTSYSIANTDIFSNYCYGLERAGDYLWIEHTNALTRMKLDAVSSTQDLPTALPESLPRFTLYPNPTRGTFHVKNEIISLKKYEVYTILGEQILSDTSDEEIWSATLLPGVYFIKVTTAEGESVERIIVTGM